MTRHPDARGLTSFSSRDVSLAATAGFLGGALSIYSQVAVNTVMVPGMIRKEKSALKRIGET
jgi:hypothetical protein